MTPPEQFEHAQAPEPASPDKDAVAGPPSGTIPVIEEAVAVARVVEPTGGAARVRITAREEPQRIALSEAIDELAVERVPVNRYVSERSGPRQEGEVLVIPVFETVAVVEQRLLLKEEVHIRRQRRELQRETEVLLRKESAVVERRQPGQEAWNEVPPEP